MGIFQWLGKSESVIHSILRKLEETGSCEAKKPPIENVWKLQNERAKEKN